jgi:hypothetical protein
LPGCDPLFRVESRHRIAGLDRQQPGSGDIVHVDAVHDELSRPSLMKGSNSSVMERLLH